MYKRNKLKTKIFLALLVFRFFPFVLAFENINKGNELTTKENLASAEEKPIPEEDGKVESEPEGEGKVESEPEGEGKVESEPEGEGKGEFEPESEAEFGDNQMAKTVFITLYSICIFLTISSNLLVVIAISRHPILRKVSSNVFLLSLVTARASVGLLVIPARITGMFSEGYLSSTMCKLCHFAASCSSITSILSIVAIAILRYQQFVIRGEKTESLSLGKSALIVALLWLIGGLYSIRAGITNDQIEIKTISGDNYVSCTLNPEYSLVNKIFGILEFFTSFFLPVGIVIYCYCRIIYHPKLTTVKPRLHRKQVGMFLTLIILLVVCNSPIQISLFYTIINERSLNFIYESSFYLLSYSNSWFNIIVFLICNQDLRNAMANLLCFRKNKIIKVAPENNKENGLSTYNKSTERLHDSNLVIDF